MLNKPNKHSKYNKKRKQVLKIEELIDDSESMQFWEDFKQDMNIVSGNTKQGIKELYAYAKDKGYFDK